ncbi:unnamed protein product, partial [Allacma fusca]
TNILENPFYGYRLSRRVLIDFQELIFHKYFRRFFSPMWRKIIYFFWRSGWPAFSDGLKLALENILMVHAVQDNDAE